MEALNLHKKRAVKITRSSDPFYTRNVVPIFWIRYALAGCLLHATAVSSVEIELGIGPLVITFNPSSIHRWIFVLFIVFCALTGYLFLGALGRVLGAGELPRSRSATQWDTGRFFEWLSFLGVLWWLAQLIIYTVFVRDVYVRKPAKYFPYPAFVARYVLAQLADLFVVGALLQLIHYRRACHDSTKFPSQFKKAFDMSLTIVHVGVLGYTSTFPALSAANPGADNRHRQWLASYYVYTAVYVIVVANVTVAVHFFVRTLAAERKADRPFDGAASIAIPLVVHAMFKVIMAIVYSQHKNSKINYDVLRLFEVLVLGTTYFMVMRALKRATGKTLALARLSNCFRCRRNMK